jgi:predicted Zn-dependent protease
VFFARVLVEIFDRRYDEAIRLLSSGAPDVIAGQFRYIPRAELCAQVYGLMGRHDVERAYYDSARRVLDKQVRERPNDPWFRSALGVAYAGLGRSQEAVREGRKAVELLPISLESYRGY